MPARVAFSRSVVKWLYVPDAAVTGSVSCPDISCTVMVFLPAEPELRYAFPYSLATSTD